jgi:hypothetical protein
MVTSIAGSAYVCGRRSSLICVNRQSAQGGGDVLYLFAVPTLIQINVERTASGRAPMSALDQKRTSRCLHPMSALPPKAEFGCALVCLQGGRVDAVSGNRPSRGASPRAAEVMARVVEVAGWQHATHLPPRHLPMSSVKKRIENGIFKI